VFDCVARWYNSHHRWTHGSTAKPVPAGQDDRQWAWIWRLRWEMEKTERRPDVLDVFGQPWAWDWAWPLEHWQASSWVWWLACSLLWSWACY